jgi:hypothetical protein
MGELKISNQFSRAFNLIIIKGHNDKSKSIKLIDIEDRIKNYKKSYLIYQKVFLWSNRK